MEYAEELKQLSEVLRKANKIASFDRGNEAEADTLAYALLDIRESFEKIYKIHLPALQTKGLSAEDIEEIMIDIEGELNHIFYHDSRYCSHLLSYRERLKSTESN
ncbi:MAG: hypothetical protein ACX93T_02305 [Bacteroidota bacterium]